MKIRILKYIFPTVLILGLWGCTKDNDLSEDETQQEDSSLRYSFTSGTIDYSGVVNSQDIISSSTVSVEDDNYTWNSSIQAPGFKVEMEVGPYALTSSISEADYLTLFSPGERSFPSSDEAGFNIIVESPLGLYESRLGEQPDSHLEILEVQEDFIQGNQFVKVHMTFICRVYSVENPLDYIVLTDGVFVNYFSHEGALTAAEEEEEEGGGEYEAPPCDNVPNTIEFNSNTIDLDNVDIEPDAVYGDWAITSSGNGSLRFDFAIEVTSSGVFTTTTNIPLFDDNQVYVSGVFGSFLSVGEAGETVYVEVYEEGYRVTFCDLTFSNTTFGEFFTSSCTLDTGI